MIKYHQKLRLIPLHLGMVEYNSLLLRIKNDNLTIDNNLPQLRRGGLKWINIAN